LIVTLFVLAIELSYIYIVTAGTFVTWPTWNANYNLQAEGFRSGHLYLPIAPSPELLAKRNPYDWANVRLWFWDASLYQGHYYLYWGPVPALAVAAVKTVFRMTAEVGDQYPLFAFYTLYLVAGALFLDRLARRLFPGLPLWLVLLGIAVFAYANPTPFEIATPGIYEAAIAGGQAFLLLGLLLAFDAVWRADAERPPPRRFLIGAGVAWALSIGCRVSTGPVVALVIPVTILATAYRRGGLWRRMLRDAALLAGPVALGVMALLVYNRVRFGSWLEFGIRYQLNTLPLRASLTYLPLNIYSYLMRPLALSCRFPFVNAIRDIGVRGFPSGMRVPGDYATAEPLVGSFVSAPVTWLALAAPIIVAVVAARRWRAGDRALGPVERGQLWTVTSLAIAATVTLLPVIGSFAATMRYLSDVATGIVLLSVWVGWVGYQALGARPWPRRLWAAGFIVLAAATVVLGLLLGLQGYDEMFKNHNPTLYRGLVRALSICRK
jgi:hypothetical protein